MAIKKISEFVSATPSSDSKILFEQNEKGKSCTIGDVGKAIGINIDLLWENASPSSEFAEQNLNVDLSAYKIIYIQFLGYAGTVNENYVASVVDKTRNYIQIGWYGAKYSERPFKCASSNIIYFGNSKTGNTTNNSYIVPYKIYGVK